MLKIIDLTYKVSLEKVMEVVDEHRAYLQRFYDEGLFICSGPKDPRSGGVILAKGDLHELENIAKNDPFYLKGIADFTITSFNPVKTSEAFASIIKA